MEDQNWMVMIFNGRENIIQNDSEIVMQIVLEL